MFLPKTPIFFSPIQSVPAHAYPPRPARQSRWDFPSPRPPPALPSSPPTTIPPSPPLSPPLHSPAPSYGAPRYPLLPALMAVTAGFSRVRQSRRVLVVAAELLSAGVAVVAAASAVWGAAVTLGRPRWEPRSRCHTRF
jgi:hypothetical protein